MGVEDVLPSGFLLTTVEKLAGYAQELGLDPVRDQHRPDNRRGGQVMAPVESLRTRLHRRAGGKAPAAAAAISLLLQRGAIAVAAGRVAFGLTVLAWPVVLARPWVGAAANDLSVRVLGRALGARDLVLGLGALAALQRPADDPGSASAWVAAGALSDALDMAVSVQSWRELPRKGRWLIAASAGGAALIGVAGALAVRSEPNGAAAGGDPSPPTATMAPHPRE